MFSNSSPVGNQIGFKLQHTRARPPFFFVKGLIFRMFRVVKAGLRNVNVSGVSGDVFQSKLGFNSVTVHIVCGHHQYLGTTKQVLVEYPVQNATTSESYRMLFHQGEVHA